MTPRRQRLLSYSSLLFAACGLVDCGGSLSSTVGPDPLMPRRSADDVLLAARLSSENAPRASLEIHRLDAYAVCNAARVRLSGKVRGDAAPSALPLASLVIGGLGLTGGVVTTALAAGLEAPSVSASTPSTPDAEPPEVEGKTGVIVAGVVTSVVVVGAVVGTLLLLGGDDDDDAHKRKADLSNHALTPKALSDVVRAFEAECPDEPAEPALAACIDRARVLRKTCAAQL
jgi:hypothetical protein